MAGPAAPDEATSPAPAARPADGCVMVIFGGAGDLTKRLLIPALCNLVEAKLLPDGFAVLGVARGEMDSATYRRHVADDIHEFAPGVPAATGKWVTERAYYLQGDFDDPATYEKLRSSLAEIGEKHGTRNALFYLATPPAAFAKIVRRLGKSGLVAQEEESWRRVVVEKPFGHDLASARKLNAKLLRVLREDQIYRIDHYLGKETVQNILAFRFGNGIFEPLWSRAHIDHVQITAAETVGVGTRGNFYDATGALRDMVPNHIFQLLALTAMEAPNSFAADAVRSEKSKVLDAVRHLDAEDAAREVVRGQYAAGTVEGEPVRDYRAEPNVAKGSQTETYVAMKLLIDNWRWAGVPFYLRTGKALARRKTEIAIRFKQAPLTLFRDTPVEKLTSNWLVLHIQPDEGMSLQFGAKVPGPVLRLGSVEMDFRYADYFHAAPSTGYETLIYDCMMGDATLFQSADNIETGWRVVQPILDAWQEKAGGEIARYDAGSAGPREAASFIAGDGRRWRPIDTSVNGRPS
jgi:glucose-6-phosphate 1-dehydrogenase